MESKFFVRLWITWLIWTCDGFSEVYLHYTVKDSGVKLPLYFMQLPNHFFNKKSVNNIHMSYWLISNLPLLAIQYFISDVITFLERVNLFSKTKYVFERIIKISNITSSLPATFWCLTCKYKKYVLNCLDLQNKIMCTSKISWYFNRVFSLTPELIL